MDAILAAKLVSVPAALLVSGYFVCGSQNSVPGLYDQPVAIGAPAFTGVYRRGLPPVVATTLVSTAAFGFLAYADPAQRTAYVVAAASVFGTLPLTGLVMFPGIHRLIEIGEAGSAEQEKASASGEVLRLMKAWTAQNWLRAGMTLAGGVAGLWAVLAESR